MLVQGAQPESPEPTNETEHPLDGLVPDPAGRPPLCDEDEFAELLAEVVADKAPRRFAVVQVYGERVDARIAAWGLEFDDHATAVTVDGDSTMSLNSAEGALRAFTVGTRISARLLWCDPLGRKPRRRKPGAWKGRIEGDVDGTDEPTLADWYDGPVEPVP